MKAVSSVFVLFSVLMAAHAVLIKETAGVANSDTSAELVGVVHQDYDIEPAHDEPHILYEDYDEYAECAETRRNCTEEIEIFENCNNEDTQNCCDKVVSLLDCVTTDCPGWYDYYQFIYSSDCDLAALERNDDSASCFPANSRVHLEDGSVKSMDELASGDRVQTGVDTFSEVFSWGHRDPAAKASFRRIRAGDKHIEVTRSHYLLVNGKLAAAESIKTGDFLQLGEGGEAEVTSIETVHLKGLYNPHTLDGQIVVNGVTASIYTRAVPPVLAHYLLAVPRLLYRLGLGDVLGSYLHGAAPSISRMIPRGSVVYD